jgi:hypothetical protein
MSIINYTQSFPIDGNHQFMLVTWPNMANGDTGLPFILAEYADRSAQVEGTFGSGGIVLIEGTNDSTNWRTLNDPYSNAISITTAKIEAVTELVVAIRPKVSAGDATTSVTVSLLVRKNK